MLNWVALDKIFRALSDPTRVLEQNGLIRTEKIGRQRVCRIEPHSIRLLDQWVTPRRRVWDRRLQPHS